MKHDGMPYDPIQFPHLKLEILQFSKSISSGIFNVTRFLISVLVFVSRDYELGTKFRLIVVYLLRKTWK